MLIYAFVLLIPLISCQEIIVNTTEGQIHGNKVADGNYYAFYDVAYGGDTSGANRFKAPTPAPAYPGLYHAIDRDIRCAQPSQTGIKGVENCLTLSIYTNDTTTLKPVFVFLNGDEYTNNHEAKYTYRKLLENELLVVTMNYRLSIFGFLCLGVPEAPGNAGLKDVVQGLRWIKDNIVGFGGDPHNVVLFGQGSAASLVDIITLSPSAGNLVHKAIAIDGSALSPWAVAFDPIGYAHAFGDKLSYTGDINSRLAEHLSTTSLLLIGTTLNQFEFFNNTPLFAPCVENSKLNGSIITEAPLSILRSGNYSHIPFIYGYTDYEGTIRAGKAVHGTWLAKMQENFTNFLPVDLDFKANRTAIVKEIRSFYFGNRNIDFNSIEDYIAYHGDTMILVSVIRAAMERAKTSAADVRLMEFTFKGTTTEWIYSQVPLNGVPYGGLLNYVFNFELGTTNGDGDVRDAVLKRYKLFAQTGTPENNTLTAWNAVDMKLNLTHYLLYAGGQGPVPNTSVFTESGRTDPHSLRMSLWNQLYDVYYRVPISVEKSSATKLSVTYLVLVTVAFVLSF